MTSSLGMVNSGIGLRLTLLPDGDARAELLQSRPTGFAKAFRGLEPDELLVRLPLIFSVCKQAQAAACSAALMAAQGEDRPGKTLQRHGLRVAVETLFEAVRVLSLAWPGGFGILPDSEIAAVRGKGAALLTALSCDGDDARIAPMMEDYAETCRGVLFGAGRALPDDMDVLRTWARCRDTAAASFFDAVLTREWAGLGLAGFDFVEDAAFSPLLDRLTGPKGGSFAAAPDLGGKPAETGALARNRNHGLVASALAVFGSGLMTRLAARLVEAGRLIDGFLHRAPEIMPGKKTMRTMAAGDDWGAGIVHSARGVLIHALRLDQSRVADLRILAPTEWNFRPGGPVVRALESLGGYDGFVRTRNPVRLASLVAGVYDPCVPCNVFVERVEGSHA